MPRAMLPALVLMGCLLATHCAALRRHGAAPRGWNSYDGYGGAVSETQLLETADYVAKYLKPFGYTVLTLDEGWSKKDGQILTDEHGRPYPNLDMYPSTAEGRGMRPLSDALRARGLELGLWMMRGVPRRAATAFLPIANSSVRATAADAIRTDKNCFWSQSCYGSNYPSQPAAEYYASVAALLRSWKVSYVKADCFFPNVPFPGPQPNGYFDEDIVGFGSAMRAANITIMFSPGISVTPRNASFLARHQYAVTYRVTEDMWDLWDGAQDGTFPTGIKQKLPVAERFHKFIGANGTFPDLDMLPFGTMMHASKEKGVYGPASPTRLTRDEQVTAMTLWCITRAPLIMGGRLPLEANDTFTLRLLTNPEVLYLQNSTRDARPLTALGAPGNAQYAWAAVPNDCPDDTVGFCAMLALFNAGNSSADVLVPLEQLRLANASASIEASEGGWEVAEPVAEPPTKLCARDLWARAPLNGVSAGTRFGRRLPPHGAAAYLLWRTDQAGCSSGADIFSFAPVLDEAPANATRPAA